MKSAMESGKAAALFKRASKAILAVGALVTLGACAVVPAGPPQVYGYGGYGGYSSSYGGAYIGPPAVMAPAPVFVPGPRFHAPHHHWHGSHRHHGWGSHRGHGGPRPGWGPGHRRW